MYSLSRQTLGHSAQYHVANVWKNCWNMSSILFLWGKCSTKQLCNTLKVSEMICAGDASQTEISGPGVYVLMYVLERRKEYIPEGRGMLTNVMAWFL